jgi:hypothetical protein
MAVTDRGEVVCYSPEADLIAGVVVGAVGLDALRHADGPRDRMLAAVPLVFAGHQLIEAVAWWGLQGRVSPDMGNLAVLAFLVVALGVVPVLIPYAVMRVEPIRSRRARMLPFVALGFGVSVALLFGLATNPYSAAIGGRYIAYETTTPGGDVTVALYGIAVCVPLLMSSHRRLFVFGVANVVALSVLSVLLATGLVSLWCIWAAVWSVVIARHIREASSTQSEASLRVIASD